MLWSIQILQLEWPSMGMPPHTIWQLYNMMAVPMFTDAADVWYTSIHKSNSGKKTLGSVDVIKKITPSQWWVTRTITGALSTTARDTLDAHTFLLPVDMLFDTILYRVAVHLASLLHIHPLHRPVQQAARHYVKKHRSPLHHLFFTTKVMPDMFDWWDIDSTIFLHS